MAELAHFIENARSRTRAKIDLACVRTLQSKPSGYGLQGRGQKLVRELSECPQAVSEPPNAAHTTGELVTAAKAPQRATRNTDQGHGPRELFGLSLRPTSTDRQRGRVRCAGSLVYEVVGLPAGTIEHITFYDKTRNWGFLYNNGRRIVESIDVRATPEEALVALKAFIQKRAKA